MIYLKMLPFSKMVTVEVISLRTGVIDKKSKQKILAAGTAYNEFLKVADKHVVDKVLEETRKNYTEHMIELLDSIKVPKILLWFSQWRPDYQIEYTGVREFFGKYPQLINGEILKRIISHADYFVECIFGVGLPQELKSRFTGDRTYFCKDSLSGKEKRKHYNTYYPSPEMHQMAFDALIPACQDILLKY